MGKSEKSKINIKERVDDTTIDLSLSDISEIPVSGIANFKRATILDLSSNKITSLGKTFCTLTHLTKLDLSKNQLKFLPEDISKLANLRHLDLYNNKLEHLPLGFGKLKSLRYLDLKGNPLTPALAKIVGPCLTQKDCQNAARTTVKFFAELQQTINEDRERARLEELERQEAEKEKEQAEAVKEKPKAKTKRERKKEPKPDVDSAANSQVENATQIVKQSDKRTTSFGKMFFRLFLLWTVFAVGVIFTIAYSPHIIEGFIGKLPPTYQTPLLYHLEKIRQEIWKYLK
ncbi:leucine-rich repeat-containing protein 59 [Bradysia coprophila]|uniref:leucine-rich repeat-containing protein 59 n=1 Tax=Bradysia coprophila TaxID=38358 RepID=UPI00187D78F2|nr:leucine-rich repeat-containing protein 59 [Bradysia coprophila]